MFSKNHTGSAKKGFNYYFILIGAAVLFLSLPVIPLASFNPDRDSGVFLYIADQIRNGAIAYRDIWDHKGPIIFLIYAIGLAISSGSLWGPWLISTMSLAGSACLSQKLLSYYFPPKVAFITSFMWILAATPTGLELNLTEGYALPLQFLALIAVSKIIKSQVNNFWSVIFGLSGAFALLLKPNLIGVWIGSTAYLLINKHHLGRWRSVSISIISGVIALGVCALYFSYNSAIYDMYNAVWKFNNEYASADAVTRLRTAWALIKSSSKVGFSTFALIALFVALINWKKQNELVKICCFVFPMEILLASLSGRQYQHYYIPLFASGSVLLGWGINELTKKEITQRANYIEKPKLILFYFTIITQIFIGTKISTKNFSANDIGRTEARFWINNTISKNEKLLILGAEAGTYFMTGRKSACRLIYQYPILQTWSKQKEFLAEFEKCYFLSSPDLVIDAMKTDKEGNSSFMKNINDDPQHPKALESIWNDLDINYKKVGILPNSGWEVYRKIK